jgi:1,4-dihydroxy-2-naphthoate polyprenyltransferase
VADTTSVQGARATGLGGWVSARALPYLRLGNLLIPTNYLGAALWWSLLPEDVAGGGRAQSLLVISLLAFLAVFASASALDDLAGYRDGSDGANYAEEGPGGRRPRTGKPLVVGALTEGQAERFARTALVAAVCLFAGGWWVAGSPPLWYGAYLLVWAGMLNYSVGLKLSYVGAQESVIWATFAGSVLFPYALVMSTVSAKVVLSAVLFGCWTAQVALFSNMNDVEGDRAVDRRTWAVRLGPRAYRPLVMALFALQWLLLGVAALVWSHPLYTATAAVLAGGQLVQLWTGFRRGDALLARKLGFRLILVGVMGTCLANYV